MTETKQPQFSYTLFSFFTGSLLLAIGSQTFWALHNTTMRIGSRFLIVTVIAFAISVLLTKLIKKIVKPKQASFENSLAQIYLALCGIAPYFIIYNTVLRTLLVIAHLAVCGTIIAQQFNIVVLLQFYKKVEDFLKKTAKFLFRPALYIEVGDVEANAIEVRFFGNSFKKASVDDLKDLVLQLIYDLPTTAEYEFIDLNLDKLEKIDTNFDYILGILAQFNKIMKVKALRIKPSEKLSAQIDYNAQLSFIRPYLITTPTQQADPYE